MIPATTKAAGTRTGAALLMTLALMACEGKVSGPQVSTSGITTAELDRDIFLPSCAFGACHGSQKPAAMLDLSHGLCGAKMIHGASCLFPGKRLVVPGNPEQSFLIDKLTGLNLAPHAETDCSTTGNVRMPLGGTVLSADDIQRVTTWIKAGANCPGQNAGDAMPPSGQTDGGTDGATGDGGGSTTGDGGQPVQLSLESPAPRLRAGERLPLTLTISPIVGPAGLSVVLETDNPSALGAPAVVFVSPGASHATFEVQGKRPTASVKLTASVGTMRVDTALVVDGLFIAEVFYGDAPVPSPGDHSQWVKLVNVTEAAIDLGDYKIGAGRTSYRDTTAPLSGVLAPGTCVIVGGPESSLGNGAPQLGLLHDFDPDLPRVDAHQPAVGVALLAVAAGGSANPTDLVPIDAVVAGGDGTTVLLGAGGLPAARAVTTLTGGHTLGRRDATTWIDQARPTPTDCPRW